MSGLVILAAIAAGACAAFVAIARALHRLDQQDAPTSWRAS